MGRTVYFVVGDIQFEWDENKAEGNLEKHHLSFEDGATVFKDYDALLLDDPDQFDDEVRFELLGYSTKRQLLVVVHVERGARFRIVSVRIPTKPERSLYEESRKC
jgi:uncharacterized DUF497 family protein